MQNKLKSYVAYILRIAKMGVARILTANIINSAISLAVSVVIVRIVSKVEYGYYGWAYNIVSLMLVISGLGIDSGILQFCSEKREENEKRLLYRFGLKYGLICNSIISLAILLGATFLKLSLPEGKSILQLLSLYPILYFVFMYLYSYIRTKLDNKAFSKYINVNSISRLLCMILGALLFGIYGYIVGYYASYLVSISYAMFKTDFIKDVSSADPTQNACANKKEVVKYSLICCINNSMSRALYLVDTFLIGIFIADASVLANYKVSTTIPFALYFITQSIMVYAYPYYANNKDDYNWIQSKTKNLIMTTLMINVSIGLLLFVFANLIVTLIYGAQYADAVPVFRLIAIAFTISASIRIPFGSLLSMLRQAKSNLIIDCVTGVVNVVLDVILIKAYGSYGAAIATISVFILSSIIEIYVYRKYCRKLKARNA